MRTEQEEALLRSENTTLRTALIQLLSVPELNGTTISTEAAEAKLMARFILTVGSA